MKANWKVFIMTVIGFLVTTISTLQDLNAWYVVLVTLAFAGEYALTNFWFPSTPDGNVVYWKNIVKGLVLSVLLAVNSYAASLILPDAPEFSAKILWSVLIGAFAGYFTKTIPANVVVAKRLGGIKRGIGVIIFLLAVGTMNAQGPLTGFFKTSDQAFKTLRAEGDYSQWMIRPYVVMSAATIDFSEKPVLVGSLNAAGMGFSYGKYVKVGENIRCNLSVNATLFTQIDVAGTMEAKIGPAVTVGALDNLLNVGVTYLDKKVLLLLGIAYTF